VDKNRYETDLLVYKHSMQSWCWQSPLYFNSVHYWPFVAVV